MLVGAVLLGTLHTTSTVFATSGYDNTINPIADLKYNDESENVVSASGNWMTHMYNACGSTIYGDFLQALDGGAYAVAQEGTDDDYGITVVWSKPDHTIPGSSFNTVLGSLKYFATDPGWQGKARFYFNSINDQEVCGYSSVAYDNPYGSALDVDSDASQLGIFFSTYDVDYPSGYEGNSVPTGMGPVPITGNVQCGYGNDQITAVQVDVDSGVDGLATLSDDGIGGKNYAYYVSESNPEYQLSVTCSGSAFLTPASLTGNNYSWVCTVTGFEYLCAEA